MKDDAQLLREYTVSHSESAFAALVQRHLPLIYSAALRQVHGDAHLAQDITQMVFVDLARKAQRLLHHTSLSGWLYTSVRYAAASSRRSHQRRQQYEHAAHAMEQLLNTPDSEANWDELKPLLDDAMHHLGETERHAVILRYFEGKTLAEVGHALGLNENAARKRVERSVEKMRDFFSRRGVSLTTASLAAVLSANAVSAAPSGIAALVTASALTLAKTSATTSTLMTLMSITKAQIAATVLATAMIATIAVQYKGNLALKESNLALTEQTRQISDLKANADRLEKELVSARLAAKPADSDELLKLRGQVTLLNHQLTNERKKTRSQANTADSEQNQQEVQDQEKAVAIQKMNDSKQMVLAFILGKEENNDAFPTNLEATFKYLGIKENDPRRNWPEQYELAYQGQWSAITNPSSTIVVREKQAVQTSSGKWVRAYGFADGHSELHSSNDGDFEAWENEHIQR